MAASIVVLGLSGMGITRHVSNQEPDWNARTEAEIGSMRASEQSMGIPGILGAAETEARLRQNATESIEIQRREWVRTRDDQWGVSLRLLAAGVGGLALAFVLERIRTRPLPTSAPTATGSGPA